MGPPPSGDRSTDPAYLAYRYGDAGELVRLRLALHREVGDVAADADPAQQKAALRRSFEETLPTGAFRAWVAAASGRLVARSGLVLFRRPPSRCNLTGWEGYLMNRDTEPAWRGRGLATALLGACVAHTRSQTPARRIRLHATAAGRRVYERAGFVLADSSVPGTVLTW